MHQEVATNLPVIKQPLKNIYQTVTETIISQLEAGVVPWQQPWDTENQRALGLPINFTTGNFYKGINVVLLWGSTIKNNFPTNEWAGFNQWQAKKQSVAKGEKGSLVVYYDVMEKLIDNEMQKIPFLKTSYVFNKCQLKGYVQLERNTPKSDRALIEKIASVDEFVANTNAIIESHNGGAVYRPRSDKIMLPYAENFHATKTCTATEGFYGALFHELTHWTGAKQRLNRQGGKRFGDTLYATEELCAEFGAAFLSAGFGLATLEKGDHAGYIDHWLKVLKNDSRILFSASSDASKAVSYLNGLQPK